MLIERLITSDQEFCIGISENENTNHLKIDELLEIAKDLSGPVIAFQFFNSSMIIDELHLLSSAQNAVHAMQGDYMIARGLDVELVVYSSAQRQIGIALDLMGIKDGLPTLGVICIDTDESKVHDCLEKVSARVGDAVSPMFIPTSEKINSLMNVFGVSDEEMKQFIDENDLASRSQALSRCIVSRVSMVALGS